MNYKLIENSLNNINSPAETILKNRGIERWRDYMTLNDSCEYPYNMLDNIGEAVKCLIKHKENDSNVHIIVDCDVDGYGSGSMIYRYLNAVGFHNITYSLHTGKQHGLSDDIIIPEKCELLIIPDAGSNDIEQCKKLKEKGVDIIILDHHICDEINPYAIVVNNQMCSYPNKNLCGAGIVYKFLQALDDELWESYSTDLQDINALCNISDVMDMREFETSYYVDCGLNKIRSKLLKALLEKQSYSIGNHINITSIQFYITPILNAMIRIGSPQEKDLLFRAFIETDEVFKYKKRGSTEEVDEDIYTRAARLCANAKARQAKEVTKGVSEIENIIEKSKLDKNKILFVNVSGVLLETLTGLVAMKIAEKYNKPCLVIRRQKERTDGGLFYGGSCRNFDHSPINSLKTFLESTGQFEFVRGHDNAAGVSIDRNCVPIAIDICNKELKDYDFTKVYQCDFDIDAEDVDISFIKAIDDLKDLFGQGVKEPLVHISNIPVTNEETYVMGKESDSWKLIVNDEVAYVKFKVDTCSDAIINNKPENDTTGVYGYIDVVGTVSMNNYKGILTPQIIVKDYEFRSV